jgi:hypothetical protein
MEFKSPMQNDTATPKAINSLGKRWKTAKKVNLGASRKDQNSLVEFYYMDMLAFAKNKIAELPDSHSRVIYERDYREDVTEDSFAMHCLISPCFYWHLECTFAYYYKVDYDFYNCPFEQEFREKLSGMFTLLRNLERKQLQPNCSAYLKRVFKVQDKKFMLTL